MSEYTQEVIDTLRNVIECQNTIVKELRAIVDIDTDLIRNLRAQITLLKGE